MQLAHSAMLAWGYVVHQSLSNEIHPSVLIAETIEAGSTQADLD